MTVELVTLSGRPAGKTGRAVKVTVDNIRAKVPAGCDVDFIIEERHRSYEILFVWTGGYQSVTIMGTGTRLVAQIALYAVSIGFRFDEYVAEGE